MLTVTQTIVMVTTAIGSMEAGTIIGGTFLLMIWAGLDPVAGGLRHVSDDSQSHSICKQCKEELFINNVKKLSLRLHIFFSSLE